MPRLLRLFFTLVIISILGIFVYQHQADFLSKYDGEYWFDRYQNSQYLQGEHSDFILSDAEFNAVKGYRLVVKGDDPTSFPAGHPPLATYFIGLSILIFHNPNVLSLVAGIATLCVFYHTCKLLLKSGLWSAIATLLFAAEPLFLTQLNDAMLDIYQLLFAVLAIYFFVLWLQGSTPKYIILSQLSLGLMLATKFFLGGLPLVVALLGATVFTGDFKRFKQHIFALIFVGVGFALGHLTYFFYHPSPLDLFRYQRYLLSWWAGSPQVPPFQVWDLIFANRWHTWWGNEEILSVPEWHFTWPIITSLAFISLPLMLIKQKFRINKLTNQPINALYMWLLMSFFLFSFEAIYPRHLLLVFPALYLLSGQVLLLLRGRTLK